MFPKFLTQSKPGPGPALPAIPVTRALPLVPVRTALTSPIPLSQNLRQVLGPSAQPVRQPVPFPAWLGQSRPAPRPVSHSLGHLNQLAQAFSPPAAPKPLIGLPIFPSVKQEISRVRAEAQAWRLVARSRTGLLGKPLQTLPGARPVVRTMTAPPNPPLVRQQAKPKPPIPPKPDVKSQVQPKAMLDVKPPLQPKLMLDVKPPLQPKLMLDVKPQATLDVTPPPQPKSMLDVKPQATLKVKPQVQPKAMLDVKPHLQLNSMLEVKPQVAPKVMKDGQPAETKEQPLKSVVSDLKTEKLPPKVEARPQLPLEKPKPQEDTQPRSDSRIERDNGQVTAAVRPPIESLRPRQEPQTPEFVAAGLESPGQFGQGQGQGGGQQQHRRQQQDEHEEGEDDNDGPVDLRLEFDWLAAQDNLMALSSELREATYGLRERPATSICLEDLNPGPRHLVTPAQAAGEKSGSSLEQRGRHGVA